MVAEPGSSKDHQKPAPVSEKNKNQCSVIEIRILTKVKKSRIDKGSEMKWKL